MSSNTKVYSNISSIIDFCHERKISVDSLASEAIPFANVKGEYTLINKDGFWQKVDSVEDLKNNLQLK